MKKIVFVTSAALLIAGLTAVPASAKKGQPRVQSHSNVNMGSALSARGNNAELMSNNGNSGQASNSLGHIQGGNIGGGK